MARNKEGGQGPLVLAAQWEWLWFPVTCSAEDPATFTTEETNGRHSLHGPQAVFTNCHPAGFCVHRCQLHESFLPLSPASLCQPEPGICTSSQPRPLQLREYKTLASSPAAGPPCCASAQGCPSSFVPALAGLAAVPGLPCLLYVCLW